ncbi:hypothetical protein I3843_12G003400 [Carya illinoinensis]|nr:hypothetical protein I3843_12G003400 [Carya illinoinensis]
MAHCGTSSSRLTMETPPRVSTPSKIEVSERQAALSFEGFSWRSTISKKELTKLQAGCRVPMSVELVILSPDEGSVDEEGFFGHVTLMAGALSSGLRLPFFSLVRDVLDFLQISLAQLSPHDWHALLCSCVVFRMALEPLQERYPDLTAREFFSFYGVTRLPDAILVFTWER